MINAPVIAYVALGANLGEPVRRVNEAMVALDNLPHCHLLKASSLYLTAPVGLLHQPDFVNAAVALETTLAPEALLNTLQALEAATGRVRSIPNAPRTLDLDLLLYADMVCTTPRLTLPHPRLHLRAFVLAPLAEIAPDLDIPGRGSLAAWLPAVTTQRIHRVTC